MSFLTVGSNPAQIDTDRIGIGAAKFCMIVENVNTFPIMFHFALVRPRYGDFWTSSPTEFTSMKTDFFTSNQAADDGYSTVDFDNANIAQNDRNCMKMSKIKWEIFNHTKTIIQTQGVASNNTNGYGRTKRIAECRYFDKYIPVKQTFFLDQKGSGNINWRRPLYFLWWWSPLNLSTTLTGSETISTRTNHVVYPYKCKC